MLSNEKTFFLLFQDYDGQGRAEFMSQTIIVIFGVVGLILGWYLQQFSQTVFIVAAGFIIAAIVSIEYIVDVLCRQPIKLFQVVSTSEFHEF